MEEPPDNITLGKLFSRTKQQLRTCKNGKFEQMQWTKRNERTKSTHKQPRPSCCQSLEMPMHAMEFLCRSWSPSASDFLQTFSPNNQVWDLDDKQGLGLQGQKIDNDSSFQGEQIKADEEEKARWHLATSNRFTNLADRTWMKLDHVKEFLKEKSLTSILRRRRERKKEEARLMTAKLHAALSVAQLAAAITGFVSTEPTSHMNDQGLITRDMNMGNIVAYAAAMVATVCAESAESTGADKAHVASAINSGLAAQSPADLMTLIATAATCLRGAATLRSRAVPGLHTPRFKKLVKLEAKLSIITPAGQRVDRFVSIHSMHGQLRLSLEKKYLGVLMTRREYTILNVIGEKRAQGCYLLSIKCEGGEIKLRFKDEQQSLVWMSNISSILSCKNISMTNK